MSRVMCSLLVVLGVVVLLCVGCWASVGIFFPGTGAVYWELPLWYDSLGGSGRWFVKYWE